jgi:hypothetical protein
MPGFDDFRRSRWLAGAFTSDGQDGSIFSFGRLPFETILQIDLWNA